MQRIIKKDWAVALGAVFCCALWGSAIPFIKTGYKAFSISDSDTATQILFAGIRFFLAGILTVAMGSIAQKKLIYPKSGSSLFRAAKLSVFQTIIQYVFFYIGLAHTSGVKASILDGISVFIAIFVSCIIFRMEKLTALKIIGSLIGFAGVFLINISSGEVKTFLDFSLTGEGFLILSTVGYACSSVFMKRYSVYDDTSMLSGYQFIIGGAVMTAAGILFGGKIESFTAQGIGILIYLAFVSAAAYSVWALLLKYNDVSHVAVYGFLTPVFGSVFSTLMLGENTLLSLKNLISLILMCVGIVIVNVSKKTLSKQS